MEPRPNLRHVSTTISKIVVDVVARVIVYNADLMLGDLPQFLQGKKTAVSLTLAD